MTKPIVFFVCQTCNTEFKGRRRSPNLYCSAECSRKRGKTVKTETCLHCKQEFSVNSHKQKFCSQKCSCTYNNLGRDKSVYKKLSENHKNSGIIPPKAKNYSHPINYYCNFCGTGFTSSQKRGKCICLAKRKQLSIPNLHKFFGLSYERKGTPEFDKDVLECINLLRQRHVDKSVSQIANEIGFTSAGNLRLMMHRLDIKTDSYEKAMKKVFEREQNGGASKNPMFKQGYKTIGNKTHFYRSGYELLFIGMLERRSIDFDMESLRIDYTVSATGRKTFAIPDFIFESKKIIVEAKTNLNFKEEIMKDKFKAYNALGYTPYLWLDKRFYKLDASDQFICIDKDAFFSLFEE